MRILYASDFFWPYLGGVEVESAVLLSEMVRRGHEVLVVTSHGNQHLPDTDCWRGVSIHRLPLWQAIDSKHASMIGDTARRVIEIKRTFAPDVIHVGMVGPAAMFHLQSSRQVPVPTLATVQTDLGSVRHGTMTSRLLQGAHWVRCVSARLRESTCGQLPELRSKTSVLYSFFPIEDARPSPLPFTPPRLLCLSRLAPEKNLSLALEAFGMLRSTCPNVRLVIAGEGPEHGPLVQRAAKLELSEHVEFAGRIEPDAVPALLNECTALVLTSVREGLPTAAIAAASMGRPIVATRVGSIDEVVVHGSTGLVVEPSADAVSAGMIRLLRAPDEAARMGTRAHHRARELFDQHRCIDAFETLYERIRAT